MCYKKIFLTALLSAIILANVSCSNYKSNDIEINLRQQIIKFLKFTTDWLPLKKIAGNNPAFLSILRTQKKLKKNYASLNKNIDINSIQNKIIERMYIVFYGRDIISISSKDENVLMLKRDGTVFAIGNNDYGQCNVKQWKNIIRIGIGNFHSVGLKADGTVVAAGNNDYGQCNVADWKNVVEIAAGDLHTAGLKADGTVVAAGNNDYGQCQRVQYWKNIIKIRAGKSYTMGLHKNKTIVYAGYNESFS